MFIWHLIIPKRLKTIVAKPLNCLRNKTVVFVSIAFLFLPNCLIANDFPPITILGIEKGLSNNSVRCIYQDHLGYMWFGTFDGLNRYDGYDFKVFRNNINDSNSIIHNYITAIAEDTDNNLWIGTGQGIGIYNNLNAGFKQATYLPIDSKNRQRISFNINVIKKDSSGNLFIATNGGGLLYKPADSDISVQLPCVKDENGICRNDIQSLAIDQQQRVWICVADAGLFLYQPAAKKFQRVNSQIRSSGGMEADAEGNLWVATFFGLHKYHIASNTYTRSFTEQSGGLSSNNVVSLSIDRQGLLWIGTEGGGINIMDRGTEKIRQILPGDGKNNLSSESAFAIYEDEENRKWIGTVNGGINIIDPQKSKFETIAHDPLNSNSLSNNFVSSFYEDKNQNLWIGTSGGGFNIWDRKQNNFNQYLHQPGNLQSLSHNSVPTMVEDYLGNAWVGSFGGGINKFNPKAGTFTYYACINESTGEENKNVWLLFEDRDKTLWAATYANGRLYRLNRQLDRFEMYSNEFVDVYAFLEDRAGNLWGGTAFGLVKVLKEKRGYDYFNLHKPVRAIHEDKVGRFWVGTEAGGLILFDRKQGRLAKRFTTAEGLCNNSVLNILEDEQGHLWLSTFNGLSKFNPTDNSIKNYYQEDGLQSNQFIFNSARLLKSGEMVFGGIKGFSIFNPNQLQSRNFSPPVLITGLRINNTEVGANSKYLNRFSGDIIEAVKMPFNEAVLSVDFAALEYSAPGKIKYAYYLEGWDKGWNNSGPLRMANYTRLSEGNYTLRIKATNAEGVWNPAEVMVRIVVLPPWYRSWWAYAIYFLAIAFGIVLYQRYRVNQAKMAFEIKLARLNAEKEKAERETEKLISEQEKEINEKRMSFLTNISHEFRTPLTLIINPLKNMLVKTSAENNGDTQELNIVYRNARRMLNLVDQLLNFRKTDTGADQLKVTELDFYALCHNVYLAFISQAKLQEIEYSFEGGNESLKLFGDREKIEIILYNLLSNAFKYTPRGGKLTFILNETVDAVKVEVADSGPGIPPEVGNKLFDRFYQVQEHGVVSKPGFGIGLYLVKHFVESHKGEVSYQTEPGKGTSFRVSFLKGKAHFGEMAIINTTEPETDFAKETAVQQLDAENIIIKKSELEPLISEGQSILLVDDDKQLCDYLDLIFSENYLVYQASNAEDGLKLAYQYLPDIIISDVRMPGISGIDFCKTVKSNPATSHIPIILLTGESSSQKKLEGVEGGADDYITKPFENELLLAKVANLLKSRTYLQNYFYNVISLQENHLKISEEYKAFLEKCIAIVEGHLDDENFNVKSLAAALNISHSNLYKKVKAISGQSVNAFIRFIRLRKAAELLINTNANVNEAASEVGFSNQKYFREHFAKLFGMNPSEYIKKYRKAFGKSYNLNEEGYKDER